MGNKLFVGNLSFNFTDTQLQSAFAECGTVTSAKIITDRSTGRSKGFGFVEMSTAAEAQAAIGRLNGSEDYGRAMNVDLAKPMVAHDDRRARY
ncbi:MAG: RNA-binding protein [Bdellovibrionales bacterium]|nr:RNA-binding protein [Bdellovibrionales bacterium]